MALADAIKKAAGKVVTKLGGDVTISYVTNAAYNTSTGLSGESTSDVTVKGVVEAIVKSEVNGLIQDQDKRLTVAAADLTTVPGIKDRVTINSVVHQIIAVNTIEQDNTAITFELILRS